MYDSSDPQQVARAERDWEDGLKDIEHIASSTRGRRWLYRLCCIDCDAYAPQPLTDEARRHVGLRVLEELRVASPKFFQKMLEEHYFNE